MLWRIRFSDRLYRRRTYSPVNVGHIGHICSVQTKECVGNIPKFTLVMVLGRVETMVQLMKPVIL